MADLTSTGDSRV